MTILGTMTGLFIEETRKNGSFAIVWTQGDGEDIDTALDVLATHPTDNRLELWNKPLAASPNGFAPFAFREAGSRKVFLCNTLKMLAGL
jgi:hypothetical protein